ALAEVSPELSGLVQMTLSSLKDQNPDLDFKKSLIGNLGNDIMTFQKKPRAATLAALNSAPTLTLLGSPNADALLKTVRQLVGLFPPPANDVKEQEFLGRKIYSLASPFPMAQGPEAESRLFFSASGGYLVFSPDVTLIEEYLRSGEKPGKSLREMTGLNEAAQRVGGMNTGLFGYENQLETMRVVWEVLKKEPGVFEQAFGLSPVMGRSDVKEASKDILEWLDFSLLPEFDKVSRYFHFSVYAGSARADGLSMRFFLPVPPQLKK
ncbi:MAG TPA: hypothetical protein P5186_27320, partial [Candidatus Paceibacterota bacterium]|nr:hypothetical protein [Candidatus Paceibacterota bacterium]